MGEFVNVCSGVNLSNIPHTDDIDAVLTNVPAAGKSESAARNIVNLAVKTEAKYLYLDSGGFEIFKAIQNKETICFDLDKPLFIDGKLNITPRQIYEVGKIIRPTHFISLDYPIPKDDVNRHELNYRLTMGFNVMCARETAFYVNQYNFEMEDDAKFYIALQCYNLTQMKNFLDNLETIDYDGISIPQRVHTPASLALFLFHIYRRFRKNKLPDIHLLGSTRFSYLAILAYFAKNFFNFISVDATSWSISSQQYLYLQPLDLRATAIGDAAKLNQFQMECDCPICLRYDYLDDLKGQNEYYKREMLYGHNWYVINQAKKSFYDNAGSNDDLNRYLLSVIDQSSGKRKDEVAEIYRTLALIETINKHIEDDTMVNHFSKMIALDHSR
jgi:queuine/archaeosine tRNA-ribosyltransferase